MLSCPLNAFEARGGKKLERRSDDRLSAGQTHALLRQRTHRTAAIHSVEPSEAHTHKLEKAPFYNKRAQSLLKDGKFLKFLEKHSCEPSEQPPGRPRK